MSEIKSVKLAHLVKFGNGQDWKSVEAQDGAFPVYGSGGKFGMASDFLHDGEAVLFGRKGTVDRPIYVNEKFWTVDTMYYAIPHRDRCSGKYLYYWATTIPFKTITTNTALPSVTSMDLSQLYVPLPPLESQQRVTDYLDGETAEIDAAVADMDTYLGLLKKRRRAIAVSAIFPHGFPENLLSAQSFLDLGYNSVIRIGSFAKLRRTQNSDQDAQYLSLMKGIGVIPYEEKGNVGNKKPQDLSDAFVVEPGDYLVNSMNFKIGSFGRSRYAGVASGAYLIFSIDDNVVNPDFLQYVFENDDLRAQAQNLGNGILEHRKSINWDRFRSIYLPYPSREEQDVVVESLRRETAEIDDLIAESTKLRDLLLKRRAVLITEVVTGRKQV